ncbi:MAG: hypothetical protein HOG15_03035, partial [Anaerolineae bacterium]|nr:hypothetical protein [Anaerolineae bacterium]
MTTNNELTTPKEKTIGRGINWQLFMQDNLTGSWMQTITVLFLALITSFYTYGKYEELPIMTLVVLGVWVLGIAAVVIGELFNKHTSLSRWLKENLLNSFSNSLLTLFLV